MGQSFQSLVFDKHILLTFRFVEFIAAYTLLGYINHGNAGQEK
jgi:hypothetical protein